MRHIGQQSKASFLRPSGVVGLILGALFGTLVIVEQATRNESGRLLFGAIPIAAVLLCVAVRFVQLLVVHPNRHELLWDGGMSIGLVTGVATFLMVANAGCWVVAESGYSHRLISDGGVARVYQRHRAALRRFEEASAHMPSNAGAEAMLDQLRLTVGCCGHAPLSEGDSRDYFPLAEGPPGSDRWEKGFVLAPHGAVASDSIRPNTWRALEGNWYAYSVGG